MIFPFLQSLGSLPAGRGHWWMADLNWPNNTPYHTILRLAIKAQGKEEKGGGYGVCLLKQLLRVLRSCFRGSGWTSASQGEAVKKFVMLCLHKQLLLSLLNCPLDPCVFLLSFYFFPPSCGKREWARNWVGV